MSLQTIFYFTSILLTCALTGFLAWYAWRQLHVTGARSYAYMALAESLLALTEIGAMLVSTQPQAAVWFSLRVPFAAIIPVFWLFFAMEYSGRSDWLSKPVRAALFVIPLITQVVMVTSGLHGLWLVQDVGFEKIGPFWIADTSARIPGLWYLVHTFYSTLLLVMGAGVLVAAAWRKPKLLLGQALLISLGALTALGMALVGVFNLLPELHFNPFVPGIGFSAVCYALAIFRFQFLKHTPTQESMSRMTNLKPEEKSSLAVLVFIFILMTSGITAIGYLTYQNYEKQFRTQVDSQLGAIASLKADELQDWRDERLADASLFYHNENFSERVRGYLEDPQDAEAQTKLLTWLEKIAASPEYDRVFLLDPQGVERISIPTAADPDAVPAALVEHAFASLASNEIIFLDFHRHSDETPIHLSLLVPIFDAQDNQRLGVLILRIDPNVYLYPFLQRWPVPSESGETLLTRRDGEDVLFLNALRFQPDAALNLRFPLDKTELPAVKAVLGQTGIAEGLDYRNALVISDVRAVPDSPWFLVSKMDTAEVYAPLRARLWQTILFFSTLILATGAGLMLVWRQQRVLYYRGQVETLAALRASEEKFRLAFETSPDSVAITRAKDGMFVSVNKGFEQITGYTREEVIGKTSLEVNIWKDPEDRRKIVERLKAGGEVRDYEAPFLTREGEIVGLMSAVIIKLNGEPHILNIVRDITERKQAEQALKRIEWLLSHRHQPSEAQELAYTPPYGDLVSLNTCRLILDSVGAPTLNDIVGDYLDLLDTSAAVYEKNGDYALGIFSSGWCRFMDAASRAACDTDDNREALDCGRWHCHESCWSRASKTAIETGQPTDIECDGGIHLYAMPIRVGDEVIGAINFGYGDPPQDEVKLRELASKYQVSYEELRTYATEYESRPPYIIELAKHRLHASARLIGEITERKRAEDALLQVNDRLALAQRLAGAGIWDWDLATGKLNWSPEFFHLFGLDPATTDANFDTWRSALHPADLQNAEQHINEAIRDHVPLFNEYRIVTPSGETRWIGAWGDTTYNERGEAQRMTGLCIDITARKQMDEKLKESNSDLKQSQAVAHVGNWKWNLKTSTVEWSDEMFHIFGIDKDSYSGRLGDVIVKVIHPDDLHIVLPSNAPEFAKNKPQEYRIIRPNDGEIRHIWAQTGESILDEQGHPAFLTGIAQDITERKQAETALRESEQKYRLLFDEMSSGYAVHEIICDSGGKPVDYRFLSVNAAFERMTGLHSADILGRTVLEVMPATEPIWIERYGQVALTREPAQFENYASALGKTFEVHAFSPEAGKFATIFSDITERKQAEDTLRISEKDLRESQRIAHVGNWSLNLATNQVVWSEELYKMYGFDPALPPPPYTEHMKLFTPESWENLSTALANTRETGVPYELELEMVRKDGSSGWMWVRGEAEIGPQGKIVGFWGAAQEITERKQMEEALRSSEARLRAILDATPFPVALVDVEDIEIEFWSHSALTLFGHTAPTTAEWYEIAYPDPDYRREVIERWKPAIEKARLTAKEVNTGEYRIACRDGSVRICELYAAFLRSKLVVTFNDITERKQAEEALRESEERFRQIYEHMEVGVARVSLDFRIESANEAYCRMLGYSEGELIGMHLGDITHPETLEENLHKQAQLAAGEIDHYRMEKRFIHKDGRVVHGLLDSDLIRDSQGKPGYFLGSVLDITECKLANEKLAASEVRYRRLFEAAKDGILILDAETGMVTDVNPFLVEMLSFPQEEIVGKELWELGFFKDIAANKANFLELQQKEYIRYEDLPLETADGRKFRVEFVSNVYPVNHHKIVQCNIRDITERKRVEQQLAQYTEHLEEMVDERTRKLHTAHEQLVRQERLAMLGQVAGSIGHELRNPLGVISNAIYFLKIAQPDANDKIKEYLDIIENETRTSDKIITELLDFTRIKSLDREPVAVSEMIRQTLERYPAPAAVEVALEIPPGLPMVFVAPQHILQVLGNLTVNACQAMNDSGQLTLSASVQDDMIAIAVQDTGMGISPANMSKLFEPLFTTKTKGIGLGLAVSRKLAEANGGRIEVQSEPGKGSTFTLYLPIFIVG